jgi:hypothetical protein
MFGTATESLYFEIGKCLIPTGGFMDIIEALKEEEAKLQRHLTALQVAIVALNGGAKPAVSQGHAGSPRGTKGKRILSTAARAKMSRAAKVRCAKIRAEKAKKRK